MEERFEDFLTERKYLLNVSPKTLVYYSSAFATWKKYATDGQPVTWIKNMREAGLKPGSINTHITAMNAYWKWAGEKLHLKKLREEQKLLPVLSTADIERLVSARVKGSNLTRAHLVALTILDTGLRISEVLGLRREDCELDNLMFKVKGKGSKYRVVPFSMELRKSIFRRLGESSPTDYIYGTKNKTQVTVRNLERDFKMLGQQLGITGVRFSPHTLRHTFAVIYLRNGGNVEYLRRILGHSSILTTQRYLKSLGIEDLSKVHNSLSPLNGRK